MDYDIRYKHFVDDFELMVHTSHGISVPLGSMRSQFFNIIFTEFHILWVYCVAKDAFTNPPLRRLNL